MAIAWLIAAVIMAVTIISLPWTRAAFNIAAYVAAVWPQGVPREYFGREAGAGALGFIGNIVWLVLAGWWLALGHLIIAVLFAVTIIGVPFAGPIEACRYRTMAVGKMIVPAEATPRNTRGGCRHLAALRCLPR